MEIVKQESGSVVVRLTSDEVVALNNALNESLGCLPEWEYQSRVGISIPEARSLLETFGRLQTR